MTDTEPAAAADPAPAPTPVDPVARLKSAMDAFNNAVAMDLHDRLASHAAAIKALADAVFHVSGG